MNNKAQMSSPFSMIMAIVIGGIVFIFFIGFAYKFMDLSSSLGAAEVVSAMNDEFTAFSVTDSAEKTIDYAGSFDFLFYEGTITTGGQGKEIDQIVFSPYKVVTDELLIATKAVELPYRIGNIFYVADGRTMYILVSGDDSEEIVTELVESYNSIPSNFPAYAYTEDQVEDNLEELYEITAAYETVRFIFFTDAESLQNDVEDTFDNEEIVVVTSDDEEFLYGEIEYDEGDPVPYLDYPLLIGGMVAADADSYTYSYDRVLEKLAIVTGVYYDKSKFVSVRLPTCDYTNIKTSLNNYQSFIGDDDAMSYKEKVEDLEDYNKALGGGCPEIF